MVDLMICLLVSWLYGRLVGLFVRSLDCMLVGWLIVCFVINYDCLVGWVIGWSIGLSVDRLIGCLLRFIN